MNVRALRKIAGTAEDAFLQGQADAHQDYAGELNGSAARKEDHGTAVGVAGGAIGAGMALKGWRQMHPSAPRQVPFGDMSVPEIPTTAVTVRNPTSVTPYDPRMVRPAGKVKIPGRRLAIGGGLVGLGSLAASSWLRGKAKDDKARADEHMKSRDAIMKQLR